MSTHKETERRAGQVPVQRMNRTHAKEYRHTGLLRLGLHRRRLLHPNR